MRTARLLLAVFLAALPAAAQWDEIANGWGEIQTAPGSSGGISGGTASRFTLWTGATTVTSDAGATWSGTGATFLSTFGGLGLSTTDLAFTGATTTGLHLKSLTTAERNATTPAAGDMIYNSTTGRVEAYDGAAWHGRVRLDGDTMTGALSAPNLTATALATPGSITVAPQGTPGSTTVTYKLVARLADGTTTEAGAASTTTTSAATLNGTNFNRLTWSAVTNAVAYDVYRTVAPTSPATTGKIVAATTALTVDDTGLAGGGETAPSVNGTGKVTAGAAAVSGTVSAEIATLKTAVLSGTAPTITGATNATPIVVTATAHGLQTGDRISISGITGNTNANGYFSVTRLTADTFSLQNYSTGADIAGNGAYGGTPVAVVGIAQGSRTMVGDGTIAEPSLAFASAPTTGIVYRASGPTFGVVVAGSRVAEFSAAALSLRSTAIGIGIPGDPASTGADLVLRRAAAATLQLGAADANNTAVAQTLKVQDNITGTNLAAPAAFTIVGPKGTGTGNPGSIVFQTGVPGTTGTTAHTASDRLAIVGQTKTLTLGSNTNFVRVNFPALSGISVVVDYGVTVTDSASPVQLKQHGGRYAVSAYRLATGNAVAGTVVESLENNAVSVGAAMSDVFTVTGDANGILIGTNVDVKDGLTAPNTGTVRYQVSVNGSGAATITPQ